MGEHGLWQKQSLFEESARVPLLIVAPGTTAPGSVVRSPVSQVDLFPTLATLCRVAAPKNLQGQSVVPMLTDPEHAGRGWAVTQVARSRGKAAPPFFGYSLRTPQWRYTEWDEGREGRELYDHDADPRELTNLAGVEAHAATVESLAKQLREAVATTLPADGRIPEVRAGGWEPVLTE
jgi:iduronate 2-sulfatase